MTTSSKPLEMFRLSVPERVDLTLTPRCNLRCKYCYFFDSPCEVAEELTTGEWVGIIRKLNELRVLKVVLSGGEPLIRDDFGELVSEISRTNIRFNILTNGTLLTPDIARIVKDSKRCNGVQISLDGLEEANNFCRGAGSFSGAVRGIRILQDHQINCHVRITNGKHNLGRLEETVHFLFDELKLKRAASNVVSAFDKIWEPSDSLLLSGRDLLNSYIENKRVKEIFGERFFIEETVFQLMDRLWPRMLAERAAGSVDDKPATHWRSCPAPMQKLSIRPDGAITPCAHLPEMVMGYAQRDSIRDVWENSPVMAKMIESISTPVDAYEECSGCEWLAYCRTSCPAVIPRGTAGKANKMCLKEFINIAPDFDFTRMEWKQ